MKRKEANDVPFAARGRPRRVVRRVAALAKRIEAIRESAKRRERGAASALGTSFALARVHAGVHRREV
jgi:hypothetical protein